MMLQSPALCTLPPDLPHFLISPILSHFLSQMPTYHPRVSFEPNPYALGCQMVGHLSAPRECPGRGKAASPRVTGTLDTALRTLLALWVCLPARCISLLDVCL